MTNNPLVEALSHIVGAANEAMPLGPFDCIDNHGHPYQSADLAAGLAKGRKVLAALASATEAPSGDPYEGHAAREGMIYAPSGDDKGLVERVGDALADCHNELVVRGRKTREPTLDELACAAITALSSAPATGEREQIVAWLRGPFVQGRHPEDAAFARHVADAIARGDHRTQSGEMEGFQITREIEHNPYGKGWPDWMKGVTIGGYAEQGWAAFYEGRHIVSGEWGEYLKRSHLPTPDSGKAGPLTNQDGGEKL